MRSQRFGLHAVLDQGDVNQLVNADLSLRAERHGGDFGVASTGATDVGLVRSVNEDSFISYDPIFLVADGMGGHNAGEVASGIVADEFASLAGGDYVELEDVADAMVRSYERIASLDDDSGRSAGTTVAMVALTLHESEPHWLVMNLGDSRVYMLRDGEFSQISVDHSVVQELVDRGEITLDQARVHPYRNMITRALGAGPDTRPDFWLIPVRLGDRFLVCSDGVTGEVSDGELHTMLQETSEADFVAQRIVETAVAHGGRDNATAVVVSAVEPDAAGVYGEHIFTTVDRLELPVVADEDALDDAATAQLEGEPDTGDQSDRGDGAEAVGSFEAEQERPEGA
ncbi:PP2C family protein-serine/threonine phosphatase [Dermabacter hominis]|uniref:PP2C family protein-serine/threonine phosphatase n=1 Tax=Dermabacter hominis TaxID=36740 RepID=UPI0021A5C2FF|nr:protein phosphatase 2C domain-containing protein [Dermabacter hominis]MDU1464743.1 protein phosphatase 2C domain-containing protein [Dermabacter sp.]MCT1956479.1 protein phosphatase 2C domain-containing protein [Dermabacter hominis]MCT2056905.1 protein phosphatase 2C domain-containing protein [Dermabacter hominis]MCT2084366.1 protein phosphatase 2C domain-containing protein [Dermabacter hominis]MCT2092274.1 protein phosphatase 2C domain-containing protein [Dermabacter hominis]